MKVTRNVWLSDDLVFRSAKRQECDLILGRTYIGSKAADVEILFRSRADVLRVLRAHRDAVGADWPDGLLREVADFYAPTRGPDFQNFATISGRGSAPPKRGS